MPTHAVARALGVAAPIVAAGLVLAGGWMTPGYDPLTRTISRLAEPGLPGALPVELAIGLVGVALLARSIHFGVRIASWPCFAGCRRRGSACGDDDPAGPGVSFCDDRASRRYDDRHAGAGGLATRVRSLWTGFGRSRPRRGGDAAAATGAAAHYICRVGNLGAVLLGTAHGVDGVGGVDEERLEG